MQDDPVKTQELEQAAARGMTLAVYARHAPERMAVASDYGDRTFGELNANANRLARILRRQGVDTDVGVALLCRNRPELGETLTAVARSGGRLTPINWHLKPEEVAYIADDCEARVLVAEAAFAASIAAAQRASGHLRLVLAVDGEADGTESYAAALAAEDGSDIEDARLGTAMLYTSGTTGYPKGVYRKPTGQPVATPLLVPLVESAAFDPERDVALVTGPLYHAAPLGLNWAVPIAAGLGAVLMDRWDAEATLALIERYGITHTHMVATMFHRLLNLPDEVKQRYDVSSLRWIVHGAAPTPVHIKRAMIEWLGPILWEYYAATEGGSYLAGSEEWLERPGTVGRLVDGAHSKILDEEGNELGTGETGTIYFKAPESGRFVYFRAPDKTASAYRDDYFTMGDMGYHDEDGYLFLTGRSAETIISGGVNIYPQHVDDVLLQHPAVYEACTVGAPDDEWGERVTAVVELEPGLESSEQLAEELLAHCRDHLANYQRPRALDFATDLPRMPTGKIQRHKVRARYWEGHDKTI